MTDYDVIVIGSGSGGLTAAVALAQAGKRVLVCEQHEVPGGWTHSFTLEGYRFSTGVHYIGELGPAGRLRQIYEGLGVSRDIEFLELNPDGYDHIILGDLRFDIPKGKEAFVDRLKDTFPREAHGVDRYFEKVIKLNHLVTDMIDYEPIRRNFSVLPWLGRSGGDLINHYITDPTLRGILGGQAGDYAMPPSKVSAALHSAVVAHYLEGGYYPRGGGGSIPRALVRAFKRTGGELLLSTPVRKIIVENGRAAGVELDYKKRISARHIISNADPFVTFTQLLSENDLPWTIKFYKKRFKYSTSCVSLFIAVDMDLANRGFDSGNYWFYQNADVEKLYQDTFKDSNIYENPSVLFTSITTLKDPSKIMRNHHTIEAFSFTSYEPFKKWEDSETGDRPGDYEELKMTIKDRMLNVLEERIPGIRDSIVLCELGTPLTNLHYINSYRGNVYGIDKGVWQAGPLAYRARSGIQNLFLCGASTMAHGVAETATSGLIAASKVLNCRKADLLQRKGEPLRVYPCDDVSQWPEYLQRRISRKDPKRESAMEI